MAFLDELKKGITDVSGQIAKKSSEIVEVQKLKIKKSGLETDIKKCYSQIGQICFLKMEESGVIDEDVAEWFQQIVEAKASIEEIQEKINELSSENVCNICGEHIAKTAKFCSHCGAKIERPVEEPECECEEEVVEEACCCEAETEEACCCEAEAEEACCCETEKEEAPCCCEAEKEASEAEEGCCCK